MSESLYDTDFVAWSAQQAELLRRHLAGERVNGLDWGNIVEELGDLGKSETRAVASLLTRFVEHALKMARWPTHPAADHWYNEALTFLQQARERYLRSMAKDIDLQRCFRTARQLVLAQRMHTPPEPIPDMLRLGLDALMDEGANLPALVEAVREGRSA